MKNDNNKRMMLVIVFIIIFLILLLVLLYYYTKVGKTNTNETTPENVVTNFVEERYIEESQAILYTDTTIQKIASTSVLLAIQDCINTYYGYNYSENYKAVYELLDDDYVEANSINENNVFNKINKLSQKTNFFVIQAYQKEISFDQEYEYYVYGNNCSDTCSSLGSSMFIINLDFVNMTFKIIPYGIVSEDNFIATMKQLISEDTGEEKVVVSVGTSSIENNNYNSFELAKSNQLNYNIILNYINYYYYLKINDYEKAYQLLDKKYSNLRFSGKDDFYNYMKSDFSNNVNIEYINSYFDSGTNTYVALDEDGKYYIFIEESPMNFTVMLDSYTVPLSETSKKYEGATSEEKACMCVEMVKEMINNNDYQTIYKHLNETFLSNNFTTVNELQDFIERKYYDMNTFSYESYSTSNNSYIIKVKVANSDNESSYFETNFVIKLGTDITNFEMSFNVD